MTGPDAHDSPYLPPLLEATTKNFQVTEVSADKGYISKRNLEAVVNAGAIPYIPFKTNTTGEGPELWRKMWHFYQFNRREFLESYHKRSNIESTFSMIKAKFGASVRSKTTVAQMNEVLCKVLCHIPVRSCTIDLRTGHRPDFLGRNAGCPTKEPRSLIYGQSRREPSAGSAWRGQHHHRKLPGRPPDHGVQAALDVPHLLCVFAFEMQICKEGWRRRDGILVAGEPPA